ncbi:M15 family metallopeptidase [Aminipila butyrica]|uniref:D-alanyl-D-alanine dipeptidase n=1 Tax=Aminipila butyrica TaxID=433296 RepID=A0A858BV46_9FIRM|nr:M15 family metallopeptidase [Aminipila butyrica]QIB68925.1 M15 family metallopeptidase [Aminipila butyrica]
MEIKNGLVRLLDLDEDFIIELKYATGDNFTGQQIYYSNQCYIHENTARLLIEAKNRFRQDGFRVKVWDAYRPIRAQMAFWRFLPDDRFVARPPDMKQIKEFKTNHMNGLCVDLTLVDVKGKELIMPSLFDDFSERASLSCPDIPEEARKNAEYLRDIMEQVGFTAYQGEWWHFYDKTIPPVPYSDDNY